MSPQVIDVVFWVVTCRSKQRNWFGSRRWCKSACEEEWYVSANWKETERKGRFRWCKYCSRSPSQEECGCFFSKARSLCICCNLDLDAHSPILSQASLGLFYGLWSHKTEITSSSTLWKRNERRKRRTLRLLILSSWLSSLVLSKYVVNAAKYIVFTN